MMMMMMMMVIVMMMMMMMVMMVMMMMMVIVMKVLMTLFCIADIALTASVSLPPIMAYWVSTLSRLDTTWSVMYNRV